MSKNKFLIGFLVSIDREQHEVSVINGMMSPIGIEVWSENNLIFASSWIPSSEGSRDTLRVPVGKMVQIRIIEYHRNLSLEQQAKLVQLTNGQRQPQGFILRLPFGCEVRRYEDTYCV